jgi:hypothetical protein
VFGAYDIPPGLTRVADDAEMGPAKELSEVDVRPGTWDEPW